jgi:hypothetical protein
VLLVTQAHDGHEIANHQHRHDDERGPGKAVVETRPDDVTGGGGVTDAERRLLRLHGRVLV